MKGLIIFLAVCTIAAAMVPRGRRAVHEDASPSSDSSNSQVECAERTPCAWAIYKDQERIVVETKIINTYCTCKAGTTCQLAEKEENLYSSQEKRRQRRLQCSRAVRVGELLI